MTWQAAAFALLGMVLAGGIAWYERSRPPARMVALVAALAALAVAGRLLFAAIPNVVATTDIVLFTGYALGAAPGFAVGALGALVSNFWLGQGPWTPWQMAGWGFVGVGGAALAALTGRRLGRGGLALACGIAGLAYGALLDLSVMVTYGGEQSLDRYLALSGPGIPFNVAHAIGNVALALAAGPALVAMISRYRTRFEFTWRPAGPSRSRLPGAAAGPLVLAVFLVGILATPPPARAAGAHDPRVWLERQQNPDGGFAATPGEASSAAMTGWAMLGLEGAGRNPLDIARSGRTPVAYLRSNLSRIRSTGDLERTVLALAGAGVSPADFGGRDLVAELRGRRSADGSFEGQVNLTAFGLMALAGAGEGSVSASSRWLLAAQNDDGGWGFRPGAPSDADSTGAALQGLAASGVGRASLDEGVAYLRGAQLGDGGFAVYGSGSSNTQSTAWAIQGLVAAGAGAGGVTSHGHSPLDYLARRQHADGHYSYSSASDQTAVWVTAQALLAVERRALPLAAVPRAAGTPGSGSAPVASTGSGQGNEGGSGHVRHANSQRSRDRHGGVAGHDQSARSARAQLARSTDAPISPTASQAGNDESDLAAPVIGGLGLLAAALAAGFVLYRRRLT